MRSSKKKQFLPRIFSFVNSDQPLEVMDCLFLDGNETNLWFDTWTIVFENKTLGREPIANWIQGKLTVFGIILSTWIVAANFLLCLLFARHSSEPVFASPGQPSRWIPINISLIQVLIGGISIPINLVTYAKGRWIFGRFFCNASLVGQMFLVANTVWAMVAMTFDLFFRSFWHRSTRRWWTVLVISGAWVMSSLAILPMVFQLEHDSPHLLPEVCAVVMTKLTSVLLSLGVFLLPAAIAATGSVAFLVVRWRLTCIVDESECDWEPERGSSGCSDLGSASLAAAAAVGCSTVLWSPFFVVNAFVSFCFELCVEPWLWSLLLWIGYMSSALMPFAWTIDRSVRDRLKVCCSLGNAEQTKEENALYKSRLTSSNDAPQQTSSMKDCAASENEMLL